MNSEELAAMSSKNSLKSTRSKREEFSSSQRLLKSQGTHNVHFENDNENNNSFCETKTENSFSKSVQLNLSYRQDNGLEHTTDVMVNTNTIQKLGKFIFHYRVAFGDTSCIFYYLLN